MASVPKIPVNTWFPLLVSDQRYLTGCGGARHKPSQTKEQEFLQN